MFRIWIYYSPTKIEYRYTWSLDVHVAVTWV